MSTEAYRHSFTAGPADSADTVLLVHGLTGSTYDVSGLGQFLAERGYRVRGVILPGHGTEPKNLNRVSCQDWLGAVVEEWGQLSGRQHFVGLSLGGIIGANLTAAGKISPATLTMVSAPVYYPKAWLHRWVVPWLCRVKKYSKKYWIKPADFEWYRQRGKYTVIPLHGSLEMYRLVEQTRPKLSLIRTPTLIIHSRQDPVVATKSADYLARHIKHSAAWWSDESEHRLLGSAGSQVLYERIEQFIASNTQART